MKKQIAITYNGPLPKVHAGGYSFKPGKPVMVFEPVHPQIVEKILRGAKPVEPIQQPAGDVEPKESPFIRRRPGRPRKELF